MITASVTQFEKAQPAQHHPGRPGAAWLAVVGFDGSEPSRAALEFATDLIRDRDGHLEVVYVAHVGASTMMSAPAVVDAREGFDLIASELIDMVRAALDDREPRWHFQRRDGSVAAELIAAARQLRQQHGPDSVVMIVVGSAEHRRHHVIGSMATLTYEREFPMLVVPGTIAAPHKDTTGEIRPSPPAPDNDVLVERVDAERVLARAGFSRHDIDEILAPITFPAPLSVVRLGGERSGISQGALMDRLGGSP